MYSNGKKTEIHIAAKRTAESTIKISARFQSADDGAKALVADIIAQSPMLFRALITRIETRP